MSVSARLSRLPIRLRLTLAYAGAIAVILGSVDAFLYFHSKAGIEQSVDQGLRARAGALAQLARDGHLERDPQPVRLPVPAAGFGQVLDARGRVVIAGAQAPGRPLLSRGEVGRARRGPVTISRESHLRLVAEPVSPGSRLVAVVGTSTRDDDRALDTLAGALFIGGPLALFVAVWAGYGVARVALRPVERMQARAAQISAANTDARLPLPDARDELHRLGTTLNDMLDRIAGSVERERAFLSSASHELRTPLAVLKAEVEVALRGAGSQDELRAALISAGEEADRLVKLAEDLLVVARVDSGGPPVRKADVPVDRLMADLARQFAARARQDGREIVVAPTGGMSLRADRLRLEQALGDLIDNSLRHGAGPVRLSARADGGTVELHVADRGAGFPAEFLPHAFERFSRADGARGRGGTGLGLAIVDAIARAHGGRAGAANGPEGADVWLELPRA